MKQGGLFNNQTTSVTVNNNIAKYIYSRAPEIGALNFDLTMSLTISKELIKDSFNKVSEMRLAVEKVIRQHSIQNNKKEIQASFVEYYKATVKLADFYSKLNNIFIGNEELNNKFFSVILNIDSITSTIASNIDNKKSHNNQYNIEFDPLLTACNDLELLLISLSKDSKT